MQLRNPQPLKAMVYKQYLDIRQNPKFYSFFLSPFVSIAILAFVVSIIAGAFDFSQIPDANTRENLETVIFQSGKIPLSVYLYHPNPNDSTFKTWKNSFCSQISECYVYSDKVSFLMDFQSESDFSSIAAVDVSNISTNLLETDFTGNINWVKPQSTEDTINIFFRDEKAFFSDKSTIPVSISMQNAIQAVNAQFQDSNSLNPSNITLYNENKTISYGFWNQFSPPSEDSFSAQQTLLIVLSFLVPYMLFVSSLAPIFQIALNLVKDRAEFRKAWLRCLGVSTRDYYVGSIAGIFPIFVTFGFFWGISLPILQIPFFQDPLMVFVCCLTLGIGPAVSSSFFISISLFFNSIESVTKYYSVVSQFSLIIFAALGFFLLGTPGSSSLLVDLFVCILFPGVAFSRSLYHICFVQAFSVSVSGWYFPVYLFGGIGNLVLYYRILIQVEKYKFNQFILKQDKNFMILRNLNIINDSNENSNPNPTEFTHQDTIDNERSSSNSSTVVLQNVSKLYELNQDKSLSQFQDQSEAENQTFRLNGKRYLLALNNVSCSFKKGECFSLLGGNGSGKSTIVNSILSIPPSWPITQGSLSVFGNNSNEFNPLEADAIGFCPQSNTYIYQNLTIQQLLVLVSMIQGTQDWKDEETGNNLIDFYIEKLMLTEHRNKQFLHTSGGTQRKLCCACAFIGQCPLIILDEPTTGVSVDARKHIWDFTKDLTHTSGSTCILCTHNMEEAEFLSDKVGILVRGELKAQGTVVELKNKYAVGALLQLQLDSFHNAGIPQEVDFSDENPTETVFHNLKQQIIGQLQTFSTPSVLLENFRNGKLVIELKPHHNLQSPASSKFPLSRVYTFLQEYKIPFKITESTVSSLSLDSVYMNFVKEGFFQD